MKRLKTLIVDRRFWTRGRAAQRTLYDPENDTFSTLGIYGYRLGNDKEILNVESPVEAGEWPEWIVRNGEETFDCQRIRKISSHPVMDEKEREEKLIEIFSNRQCALSFSGLSIKEVWVLDSLKKKPIPAANTSTEFSYLFSSANEASMLIRNMSKQGLLRSAHGTLSTTDKGAELVEKLM